VGLFYVLSPKIPGRSEENWEEPVSIFREENFIL
jgi:hypothetical protein